MKNQTILLSLLALAIAITVGCGTSSPSLPKFTRVAFLANLPATPATEMFTGNLEGSSITPIPFSSINIRFLSTSADNKVAAFIDDDTHDVWVENADGSAQKQLTTTGNNYWSRISADGKKIVYGGGANHILEMNTDGTGSLDLTPTLPANTNSCYDASFSADSKQVAFVCSGSGAGIYTVMADGTGLKTVVLHSGKSNLDYPAFTPDGKKMLFVNSFGTPYGVFSVNIDGTGETLLVPSIQELRVLNSSMYYSAGCGNKITKSNLDGTNPVDITDGTHNDSLYFSPNAC